MYAQPNFKLYLTLLPNSYTYMYIWILINIFLKNTGRVYWKNIYTHIYSSQHYQLCRPHLSCFEVLHFALLL